MQVHVTESSAVFGVWVQPCPATQLSMVQVSPSSHAAIPPSSQPVVGSVVDVVDGGGSGEVVVDEAAVVDVVDVDVGAVELVAVVDVAGRVVVVVVGRVVVVVVGVVTRVDPALARLAM